MACQAKIETINTNLVNRDSTNIISLSTTTSPTPYSHLTNLPAEVHAQIFQNLPSVATVLSVALVHSSIYGAFKAFERQILLSIFHRHCERVKGLKVGEVFWELLFVIRQSSVDRDIARELFTLCWQVFRKRRLEELLLPLGRALAWSYCLDGPEGSAGREEEAVALLMALVRGNPPFDHKPWPRFQHGMPHEDFKRIWPKVTLAPVLQLLEQLNGSPFDWDNYERFIWKAGLEEQIFIADIRGNSFQVFPMKEEAQLTLQKLRHGIQFSDRRALVGIVDPGRAPYRYSTPRWEGLFGRTRRTKQVSTHKRRRKQRTGVTRRRLIFGRLKYAITRRKRSLK